MEIVSLVQCGVVERVDGLGGPTVTNFPEINNAYEWGWQPQVPATEGVKTAGMPAALSVMPKSRATLNSIPSYQAYGHPNAAWVDPQVPISLGHPIRQVEQFMGSAPILAPQPASAADVGSRVLNNDQGIADLQRNNLWSGVPFDGPGAFGFEISEESSSGGVGEYMGEGYVGSVDERGLSPWTPSTATASEYGAQEPFLPGHNHGAQFDHLTYAPQTHPYIEQNGGGGEFEYCHSRDQCLTIWS